MPARSFWRVFNSAAVCSGLVLAGVLGVPGVARAQAAGPGCATPAAGQVGCGALVTPGSTAVTQAQLEAAATAPAGLSPANLQDAYGFQSGSAGMRQTVAVVTAYDDATAETDMGTYRSEYSIPGCTTADGCFSKVNETGGTTYPPAGPAGWSLATAQSLDMISAVCPNCHIDLVEATSTGIGDLGPAENEAVSLGAKFVTNTWFTPEATYGTSEPTYDGDYFNHPGVAITAPDGNGAGYGTYYPAASPDVIAVGGTTLTAGSGTARGWTEAAWSGTGSGCSPYEAKPSWQADTGCATRMLNDVSAVADPSGSPVAFYDTGSGGWVQAGGTGAAAAIIAAAYALAGTPASDSYPASYLYANVAGLYDITTGSDGTCSPSPAYFCTAGTGYDGPTGLGTPDGVSALLSGYYQPITPTRFLDTRNGTGGITGPVKGGATAKLKIAGVNGVPAANVTAVAINVAAVDESSGGFLTAFADGTTMPATSNLDYAADTTIANLMIVPVGADGEIDIFNNSSGTTHLVADVSGYFTSDASAAGDTTYKPVTPIRVLDTRNGTGAPEAKLAGGGTLSVQIGGANGIPSGIAAVAINITTVNASGTGGFLTDYADGTTAPGVSNLQFGTLPISEMAIVPAGADGKIDIHNSGSSSTDVVGDVSGYFTAGTGGETYHAIAATRLIDTRKTKAVAAGATLAVTPGATVVAPGPALVLDVIALDASATNGGFLVVHAAGTSIPGVSDVDYNQGETIANLALGATGAGTTDIFNSSSGTVEVVVDCSGYFSAG
jgi:hypothetical protein